MPNSLLRGSGLQDVALAFEPGEKGVLTRPPRDTGEGIMSRTLIERTVLVSLLISVSVLWEFWQALEQGASLEKARTLAMTTMVFFQFFQAWNSRSEYQSIFRLSPVSNPFLFYGMIAAVLSQLSWSTFPPCSGSFGPSRSRVLNGCRSCCWPSPWW